MSESSRLILSGDEAIALAAYHAGVALGAGYPGTPSTEILEYFSELGGRGQWSPNEKVALEVAIGVAYSGARAIATMKHVGLNVAADPLFTAAYTGVTGGLVIVSADDPGMASSQNEQDNRHYAVAAGIPMLEPSDSQEAYDFTLAALEISERWHIPVLLRVTTRVCHTKAVLHSREIKSLPKPPRFERDIPGRVMIPSNARPAHLRLRRKLSEIVAWNETSPLNYAIPAQTALGVITSGVSFVHVREAAPQAAVLKLSMTHPLPIQKIAAFARSVERCVVVEEGDPYLADAIRAAGIPVEDKLPVYRFGELSVARVRRILNRDASPEAAPAPGKPPQLCEGCPYRQVFTVFKKLGCIVSGDIGCYSLGALPPFQAMDSIVCMGASIGVGLGLRHSLPPEEAKRVVSVIGDSTFVHSGITGLVEMAYNPPASGHVVVILDNTTTAMTGQQEHPGTGRKLNHEAANRLVIEDVARSVGIRRVHVVEPRLESDDFERVLRECLASGEACVIVARRPCLLILPKLKQYQSCQTSQKVENAN